MHLYQKCVYSIQSLHRLSLLPPPSSGSPRAQEIAPSGDNGGGTSVPAGRSLSLRKNVSNLTLANGNAKLTTLCSLFCRLHWQASLSHSYLCNRKSGLRSRKVCATKWPRFSVHNVISCPNSSTTQRRAVISLNLQSLESHAASVRKHPIARGYLRGCNCSAT